MACLHEVLKTAVPVPAGVLATITARPADEQDHGFLRELYATTRADEMQATAWPASRRRSFLDQQFEFQHRHYRAHYPDALFLVLLQSGQPIGRLYWRSEPAQGTLIDLSLLPAWRRQGIGTAILRLLTAEADRRGQAIGLHVEPDSPALSLYHRFGFDVVSDNSVHLQLQRPAPATAVRRPAGRVAEDLLR
ncbi:MAG: GNAT family N-acetyltransferase [Burkholderiales bacterium]|nr:GNAT family N-acetyltransferase [Burkholderiales bacterium]